MNRVFLLLGSNLGNAKLQLKDAQERISSTVGTSSQLSSIYITKAWGNEDQPDFLNQVMEIYSPLEPQLLLESILEIEIQMGRIRYEKWGPRLIDIDILFFNDRIIQDVNLKIPHPEIAKRKFTLVPLTEIASEFIHPILKKTMRQLLEECTDPLEVELLKN